MYPDNWPRCLYCDDYALDGHLTCGKVECDESTARDDIAEMDPHNDPLPGGMQ